MCDCSRSASAEVYVSSLLALSYFRDWSLFPLCSREPQVKFNQELSFWGRKSLNFCKHWRKNVHLSSVGPRGIWRMTSLFMLLVWELNVNTSLPLWALWWNTCMAEGSPPPDEQLCWICISWGDQPCWRCLQISTRSLYQRLCWIATPEQK